MDPLETLGERIRTLIETKKMSQTAFAELIDSNRQNIVRVINGETRPNYVFINKILIAIPELSSEWLTRGIGPMWKGKGNPSDIGNSSVPPPKNEEDDWQNMTIKEVGEMLKQMKKGK